MKRWFWTATTMVAALCVWQIDNVFMLRLGFCIFILSHAAEEAKKALAFPPANGGTP